MLVQALAVVPMCQKPYIGNQPFQRLILIYDVTVGFHMLIYNFTYPLARASTLKINGIH